MNTIIDILNWRAQKHPERRACTLLGSSGDAVNEISYRQIDVRARAIAAVLRSHGKSGPVLVMYPSSIEYITSILGCFYAGMIAVPVFPPRSVRTQSRVRGIALDSGATLALAAVDSTQALSRSLESIAVETIPDAVADEWHGPRPAPDTLAILQYTSGSTAEPRGVMVSHENLIAAEKMIQSAFGVSESSIIVSWLPMFHDMGLIGTVLQPLFAGATSVLMSPSAFLQRPVRWLEAISNFRGTIAGGPNSAYELCVDSVPEEKRTQLDLSTWEVAFNGSEPVRKETIDRFSSAFSGCGFRRFAFRPCYGLAEATLLVTLTPAHKDVHAKACSMAGLQAGYVNITDHNDKDTRWCVSCGVGTPPGDLRIIDVSTGCILPERRVGEIYVIGPHVALGYWNRTQDSEGTFGVSAHDKETRSLRTGDLGFLLDGQLYVTGRLKDLIIVRGQNYYPEDIEYTSAASHETLRQQPCVAFAVESHGREEVIVVQESCLAKGQEAAKVIAAIRRRVAFYHGVPLSAVLLVKPHALPKTTSGKIQRGACRSAFLAGALQPIAEWRAEHASLDFTEDDDSRAWLRGHLARTLAWSVSDIEDDRPLVEYGLDSLGGLKLAHAIESRFGIRMSPADFLEDMTLANLASRIAKFPTAISRVTETIVPDEYPLSYGQLSLWHQQHIAPLSSTYNIANAVRIRSPLHVEALRRAFRHVVQRHPLLSCTFKVSNGAPVHCFRTRLTPDLVEEDVSGLDNSGLLKRLHELAWCPFDLRREPSIRLHLFRIREDGHILLLAAHHLVADLWSIAHLVRELGAAYSAFVEQTSPPLPALQAQYYEFVQEQSRYIEAHGANDLAYWRKELQEPLPVLDLPVERAAPSSPDYRSAIEPFALDEELTARLKALAKTMNATLYVATLAIFQILLHRYSGQKDIIVGSPVSGRDRPEFAQTVGYFVNTLALRADFSNDPTFGEHLYRTRKTVLDAFRHQEYPFRLVVEHLQPTVIAGEHPVFQVMLILQAAEDLAPLAPGQGGVRFRSGPLLLESIALDERLSNFPLVVNLAEMDGNLIGGFEYQIARFDRDAVRRMADHFRVLAWNAVENADARISWLGMLTREEHYQALAIWNDTAVPWPARTSLWDSVEYWIHKSPDAIALVDDKQHVSWQELDARTQRLACDLRDAGVGPDRLVGVCMERSVDLAIAFTSVLRAGGAYLPIDTEDPPQRIERLLKDANASVVVTKSAMKPLLSRCGQLAILAVDEPSRFSLAQDNAATDLSDQPAAVRPDNLAYVLFTSGSTGGPKGVMNTHRGICNRIHWMQAAYQLGPDDRVLQKTPYTFDVSVWEFFWPLTSGGTLILARAGGQRDPRYIAEIIASEQISVVHFIPSMMKLFLHEVGTISLPSLRHVISSGEALSVKLQDQWHAQFAAAALHNLYGPTEAAVDVSHWTCERREGQTAVPIGSPIANTQLYILDNALGIVPVGIPGELHIGGDALARGYVGQPALTAAAFIPSLFGQLGSRLYRTGDIARYRCDGAIEFIGRLDDQTKIRGMRVVLGEVEAAIKTYPNITDAVVLGGSATGDGSMTAWVVWRDILSASIRQLLVHLKTMLPPYMVPNRIVALDRLPVSPNGKLNRHALASDKHFRRSLDTPLLMPRDPIETEISAIWQDTLNVMPIGIHDNFFHLGGHSLQVALILERVRERFQVILPMNRFFDEPTIAEMAVAIQEVSSTGLANASGE